MNTLYVTHMRELNRMLDDIEQFRMMQHHTESIIIDSKAKYRLCITNRIYERTCFMFFLVKYFISNMHIQTREWNTRLFTVSN